MNFLYEQLRQSKIFQSNSPAKYAADIKEKPVQKVSAKKQPGKPKRKSIFEIMETPAVKRIKKSTVKKIPSKVVKHFDKKSVNSSRFAKLKRMASRSSMNISQGVILGRRRKTKLPEKYKQSEIDPDIKKNKKQVTSKSVSFCCLTLVNIIEFEQRYSLYTCRYLFKI